MNILKRFYIYQKERFPIAILTFTTLAVVLSSVAVISKNHMPISSYLKEIVLAFIAGMIFMYHIRVLDERKDLNFDTKYHKDRPIQKGIISLKSLFILDFLLIIVLFAISIYSSFNAFIFLLISMIYSLIAGMDFFLGNKIRNKFFIYNLLCLFQLFFFQIHLYSLMTPIINFLDPLLYIHFVFVIVNAGILEVGRKLKVKSNESLGKDTYSSQIGKRKSAIMFIVIIFLSFFIFSYLLFKLSSINALFFTGILSLILVTLSTLFYLSSEKIYAERLIEITGVIYYLSLHLLIFLAMFI